MKKQNSLEARTLYIGTNYHPHDWPESRWSADLELMKKASFNFIRIGHLCWDRFEPEEGRYEWDWMDRFLDLCSEYGMNVFLDIPTRPAPLWLHLKHQSIDIVDNNGNRNNPISRYMEDVGDPHFRHHALALTEAMAKRFGGHRAIVGFGLCNELGSGYLSYSESARVRFCSWLEEKYGDIESLNSAWNSQRWSRGNRYFKDIIFPVAGTIKAAPESYLDMRRFFSDEIISYLAEMKSLVAREAPGIATSTNHWAEHPQVGFDYLKSYGDYVDYPGIGFYPGIYPEDRRSLLGACFNTDHRIAERQAPMWCLEFQTGTFGAYAPKPGVLRMYAYLSLIYRSQVVCAWTWRSMLGGEEQYFFGLLDHDGTTSVKYEEFKKISEEFKILSHSGFPRESQPEVALAYSYESMVSSGNNPDFYKQNYIDQNLAVYNWFFERNIDLNIVDTRNIRGDYRLLVIAGQNLMDNDSAENIRAFVRDGGTIVMTGYSSIVNENNTVFSEPLPGRLSDLFGIEIRGFERREHHVPSVNEGGLAKSAGVASNGSINFHFQDCVEEFDTSYLELIKAKGAEILGSVDYQDQQVPVVTVNSYGAGSAVYIGLPAGSPVTGKVFDWLCEKHVFSSGLVTPKGICARNIGKEHILFVNTTGEAKTFEYQICGSSLLTGAECYDEIYLEPYGSDFFHIEKKG